MQRCTLCCQKETSSGWDLNDYSALLTDYDSLKTLHFSVCQKSSLEMLGDDFCSHTCWDGHAWQHLVTCHHFGVNGKLGWTHELHLIR